jgi:hypothetical protein
MHLQLTSYFQKRYVCVYCGYFDVMLAEPHQASFRPKCPTCRKASEPRDGFECTGKTTNAIPHITKPRMMETVIHEFPEFSQKGFRQVRRRRS